MLHARSHLSAEASIVEEQDKGQLIATAAAKNQLGSTPESTTADGRHPVPEYQQTIIDDQVNTLIAAWMERGYSRNIAVTFFLNSIY